MKTVTKTVVRRVLAVLATLAVLSAKWWARGGEGSHPGPALVRLEPAGGPAEGRTVAVAGDRASKTSGVAASAHTTAATATRPASASWSPPSRRSPL